MKYSPVIVVWVDITTRSGWVEQEEVDNFCMDDKENIVYQAGFLYEEDEKQITLLNSYFHNQDLLGDVTKIPKGCIVDIIHLNKPK